MRSIYHNSTCHQLIFHHYVNISPIFQQTPPFSSNYIMYEQHEIFHNTIFHILSLKIFLFIFFQNNINLSIINLSSKCQPMILVQYINCLYTLYIYIAALFSLFIFIIIPHMFLLVRTVHFSFSF